MSEVADKILQMAKKANKVKIAQESKKLKDNIDKERTVIEEILGYVQNGFLYKQVGDGWNNKYVLVTEKILFEDYTAPPKNTWSTGTSIKRQNASIYINVNGENYQPMAEIITRYGDDIKKSIELNSWERDQLYKKKKDFDALVKQEPRVKALIKDYQEKVESMPDEMPTYG